MRKILSLFLLLIACMDIQAQMTEWRIYPEYDNIRIADGAPLLLCDSLDFSYTVLMTLDGKRLAMTADSLHSFNEGYAITTRKGTKEITGFFDKKGHFTGIADPHVVAYDMPFFSNGFLVAYSTSNYTYNIFNTDGKAVTGGLYKKIYPYSNGLAVVERYEDYFKQKDFHYRYLTIDQRPVKLMYNKKEFEYKDVQFLTSVTDEGISYAIIKNDLYSYNVKTGELLPVTSNMQDNNPKRQVSLVEQDGGGVTFTYNDTLCVAFRKRKNERVYLFLDEKLVPIKIRYAENGVTEEKHFAKNEKAVAEYKSDLSIFCDSAAAKYGILCNGDTVLPAQFKDAKFCIDNLAVVCMKNGKWGMIDYNKEKKFAFSINDNDAVGFRHRYFRTKIRLLLPSSMPSGKCRFFVDEKSGCNVDWTTRKSADTEGGNKVEYDCKLGIPMDLTDGDPQPICYPVKIVFDNIEYPVYNIEVRAWHRKYIDVSIKDSDVNVTKGDITFKIYLTNTYDPDNGDIPLKVYVKMKDNESRTLTNCASAQINGDQYQCSIDSLKEGENFIFVYVEEEGCPAQITPFIITYVKPVEGSDEIGRMTIAATNKSEVDIPVNADKADDDEEEEEQEGDDDNGDGEIILE